MTSWEVIYQGAFRIQSQTCRISLSIHTQGSVLHVPIDMERAPVRTIRCCRQGSQRGFVPLRIDENRIDASVLSIAIPDKFVTHGSVDQLYKELSMDPESVANRVLEEIRK